MPYFTLLYSRKDHVAYVTLNRPEADNVINQQLANELGDICCEINQDNDIYAVVISGTGAAFCAGCELEQAQTTGTSLPQINCAESVAGIECPVIAAINGDVLGPGLELALSCDIRIASVNARFGFPEVAAGRIPVNGGTQRLPRIIGKGKALELVLTGDIIDAEEAQKIGLVSQVFPREKLAAEAESLARSVATKAPMSLRYIKEAVNKGLDLTLEQGLRLEADLYFLLHTTDDRTEGITAFLEKRKPQFKGK